MKRSQALKMLSEFLIDPDPGDVDVILDFIEKEIGMWPPHFTKTDIEESGQIFMLSCWEPEDGE